MTDTEGPVRRRLLWPVKNRGLGTTLARGALATFSAMGLAAVVGIVSQVVLSRTLGVASFGQYAYALGWVNLLAIVAVLGFETVVVRFTATYRATRRWGELRGLLRSSTRSVVALSIVLALAGAAISGALVSEAGLRLALVAGALLLPLLSVLRILAAGLHGVRRVATGQLAQGVVRPAVLGLAVLGLSRLVGRSPTAPEAMLVNVGATTLALGVGWFVLRSTLGADWRRATPSYDRSAWTRALGPNTLITGAQALLLYTDVLMLGMIVGTREAGIYTVAAQLVMAIGLGVSAINAIAAPIMAEFHAEGRRKDTQSLLTLATAGMLAYTIVAGGLLLLFGHLLLGLYGTAFVEGRPALTALVLGQFTIAACGPVGFLSTMTGHERQASAYVAGSALANVGLNALLIPAFGLVGAAISTALAVSMRSLLLARWVRRRLGYRVGLGVTSGRTPGGDSR
jgi:O-antigen/teichoic acid export membrane protein